MKRYVYLSFILVCSMIIFFPGCSKQEKIAALIGRDISISLNEIKTSYKKQNPNKDISSAEINDLEKILNQLVEKQIKIKAAYDLGLDNEPFIITKLNTYRESIMLQELYEREILDKTIKEKNIRNFYAMLAKEISFKDIVIKIKHNDTPELVKEKKKKSEEILKKISDGENFNKLTEIYSEDDQVSTKNGFIGKKSPVNINDPIQKILFTMREGEVSKIIRNSTGFHIIKIEKINEKNLEPYPKIRDEIRTKLIKQMSSELRVQVDKYFIKLKKEANFRWNEEGLNKLNDQIKHLDKKNQTVRALSNILQKEQNNNDDYILLKYYQKTFSINDYISKLKKSNPWGRLKADHVNDLKTEIELLIIRDLLLEKAYRLHLDTDKNVIDQLIPLKENMMVQALNSNDLFKVEKLSEEQILEYYNKHKKDKYSTRKGTNFEKSKNRVKRDLKKDIFTQKQDDWISKKKEEYGVVIFKDILKGLLDESV